ncbi:MAG: hypothetical protein K0Q71_4930 [Thermomicrobiales bacterium]|jgi:hypothetical protein|nr:hypothetical protein [Thermomicrobiales bacterium]
MDGSHFDTLVKALATRPLSRASVLHGLVASATALAGLTLAAEPGTARKKKGENERKVCVCGTDGSVGSCRTKKVKADKVKKLLRRNPCASKGKCTGVNPCAAQTLGCNCDRKVCGDDGCGGNCGTCDTDQVCANGRCVSNCPDGQKVCAGNCIPNEQCCGNADCIPAAPRCCRGACVASIRCCTATDCAPNEACNDGRCACAPEFGSCGAQRFCNRDTLRCEACRGTGGSCFAGTNVISTDACCAGFCSGNACG